MGLERPALRFIIREHQRQPIVGPLLQLGRQAVAPDEDEMSALLREEGIEPAKRSSAAPTRDASFFNKLGVDEVHALDFSSYEGADIIHDLNKPVPRELEGRFNFILDGGTSEHVFDVRQVMRNIARLLKPGGRVLHMQPMNNYVNHGFYQFSPTFYFDYYSANAFGDLRGYLFKHGPKAPFHGKLYELNPFIRQNQIASSDPMRSMMVYFIARKEANSTDDAIPTQTHYAALAGKNISKPAVNYSQPGIRKKLNRGLPRPVVRALQCGMTALDVGDPEQPFFDPTRHRSHPWGLKYLGKLD